VTGNQRKSRPLEEAPESKPDVELLRIRQLEEEFKQEGNSINFKDPRILEYQELV